MKTLDTRERAVEALQLYIGGMSTEDIAKRLGLAGRQSVWKLLDKVIDNYASDRVERVRAEAAETYRCVIDSLWRDRDNPKSAQAIIKATSELVRLFGAFAPERHIHGVVSESEPTPAQAAEIVRSLFGRVTPPSEKPSETTACPDASTPSEPKPA